MQDAVILIDKPKGITSYDVIRKLQKKLSIKKIGHAGVLDKPATGLLVCATNRATKILSLFENGYKIYTAKIQLGVKTDTYDIEGNVLEKKENINLNLDAVRDVLIEFEGEITQKAPPFSNVKINGKKLYQYTLSDEDVELPARRVVVHGIKVVGFDGNFLDVMVKCSKGTYIRSLANDIGERLGVFGCVYSLRRVFSYPFSIESANSCDNIKPISINDALSFLPSLRVSAEIEKKVKNGVVFGRLFDCESLKYGTYRVLNKDNSLLAVVEKHSQKTVYRFIEIR